MFKFNFLGDDDEVEEDQVPIEPEIVLDPPQEISFQELAAALPPELTFSPVAIRLSDNDDENTSNEDAQNILELSRRDLYDAHFQLMSQDEIDEIRVEGDDEEMQDISHINAVKKVKMALEFFNSPSDLEPGTYEGGLKTWECSLDLASYLHQASRSPAGQPSWIRGKNILEIGCGTAVPTLCLMHNLFSDPTLTQNSASERPTTTFYLQDYNLAVLELLTLPNIIIAWYRSPLADDYRMELESEGIEEVKDPAEADGELTITPELKAAFVASLERHRIELRFFYGQWGGLPDLLKRSAQSEKPRFDLVMTSETIYRMGSLPSLIELLAFASSGPGDDKSLPVQRDHDAMMDDGDAAMDVSDERSALASLAAASGTVCLVAAKVMYFGVGGSILDFERKVEKERGATIVDVWAQSVGIIRKVIQVQS